MTARVPLSHLVTLATTAAARYGDKPAFSVLFPDDSVGMLRYRDVQKWSDRFAAYLQAGVGLRPGERVAVCLPNVLAFPVCLMGAVKAGASVVILNPQGTEQQILDSCRESEASVLVMLDHRVADARRVVDRTQVRAVVAASAFEFFPMFSRWRRQLSLRMSGKVEPLPTHVAAFHDVLREAKGTSLTVPQISADGVAGIIVAATAGRPSVALSHQSVTHSVAHVVDALRGRFLPGAEVSLAALPLASSPMLVPSFLVPFWIGAHTVLVPNWRPLSSLRRAFEAFPVSWLSATPRLLAGLMGETWLTPAMAERVRTTLVSGGVASEALAERWKVLSGREALWHTTGDLGLWGEVGELNSLGLSDAALEVEGKRVEVALIEAAIAAHPAVRDVAVVGLPDGAGRTRLHACVVPMAGHEPAFAELRDICLGRLEAHCCPESMEVLFELPLSSEGVLLRQELHQSSLERQRFKAIEDRITRLEQRKSTEATAATAPVVPN